MKKLFRTLASVMVAFVMIFAIAAFAGCGDENGNKIPPDNSESGTPGKPGNQALKDWTFDFGGGSAEVMALLNSVLTQKTEYASFDVSVKCEDNVNSYHVDEKGGKLDDGYLYVSKNTDEIGADAKLNVTNGDGDFSYSANTNMSESVTKNGKTETDESKTQEHFYAFLRDWNVFTYSGSGEDSNITDFSGITFNWDGNIEEDFIGTFDKLVGDGGNAEAIKDAVNALIEKVTQMYPGLEFNVKDAVQNLFVPATSFSNILIADSLGAVTYENGKATVDFNKAVYNVVRCIKSFLDVIDENTTIGDVLSNKTIKSLIEAFTSTATPENVYESIKTAIDEISSMKTEDGATVGEILEAMGIDVLSYIVEPEANSTVYGYIVKIVSSNELKELINKFLKALCEGNNSPVTISLNNTLDKTTIETLLKYSGSSVKDIKTSFGKLTENITQTEFNVSLTKPDIETQVSRFDKDLGHFVMMDYRIGIPTTSTYSLKNFKLEYSLDGYTVKGMKVIGCEYSSTSQSVAFNAIFNDELGKVEVQNLTFFEYSSSVVVNGGFKLASSAYTLEDIGSNEVNYYNYYWTEEDNGSLNNMYIIADNLGIENARETIVSAALIIVDGEITGVNLYDENNSLIEVAEDGSFTVDIECVEFNIDKNEYEVVDVINLKLYLNVWQMKTDYRVYLTREPVDNPQSNVSYNSALTKVEMHMSGSLYSNTVDGVLSGVPGEKVEIEEEIRL